VSAVVYDNHEVLPYWSMPSRLLYYTNIVKGESRDKAGKRSFTSIVYAEPYPILYKCTKIHQLAQMNRAFFNFNQSSDFIPLSVQFA